MLNLLFFLFGLIVGSFLNAVIYRLKTKESVLFTPHPSKKGAGMARSHCPKCGAVLKWSDLIPVLSFVFQKARCRYCGKKISWQYPMVELATGLLFFFVMWEVPLPTLNVGSGTSHIFYLVIISFLIIIFVYDLKHYIIPDKIVYPGIVIVFLYRLFGILNFGNWDLFRISDFGFRISRDLINPFLAAMIAGGFFLSLVLISQGKWMGLGDVKLAFLMGFILGWPNILWALFLAFFVGAVIGLGLIAVKNKTLKSQIPFGPFLAGATIFAMLFGEQLTPHLLNLINIS